MTYDAKGNLATIVDALNQTTTFSYDSFGQVQLITDAEGRATDPTYDTQGNVTSVKDPFDKITSFLPVLSFARIFTGGF